MTTNSFARVSFLLFGVLLIVQFLVNLGQSVSGVPLVFVSGEAQSGSFLASASVSFAARFGAGVAFNLIPGLVFLYKAEGWANRVALPSDEAERYIGFAALFSIGVTLLGYYFLISGLAGVVGSAIAIALSDEVEREVTWRQSASSFAMLISGAVIASMGRRAG